MGEEGRMQSVQTATREHALLTCYKTVYLAAAGNVPGVGEESKGIPVDAAAHARALRAVAAMVEAETALRVLEEIEGERIAALQRVAEASSVLLLFVDAATRKKSRLRDEVAVVSQRVHARLKKAGYVARNAQTGHRQRPCSPFSVKDLIPDQ